MGLSAGLRRRLRRAVARNLDKLGFYEALNFPGHAITDMDIKAAAEKALGRQLKLTFMPWWVLRAGSPFCAMLARDRRDVLSPVRTAPARIDRLEDIIGEVPHTPLDEAVGRGPEGHRHRPRSCKRRSLGIPGSHQPRLIRNPIVVWPNRWKRATGWSYKGDCL